MDKVRRIAISMFVNESEKKQMDKLAKHKHVSRTEAIIQAVKDALDKVTK